MESLEWNWISEGGLDFFRYLCFRTIVLTTVGLIGQIRLINKYEYENDEINADAVGSHKHVVMCDCLLTKCSKPNGKRM